MTNEITSLQTELMIAKQQAEIAQLQMQLQKVQAQKSSRLDDSLFSPALCSHYQKIAEKLATSSIIPQSYKGKPEDIFVAMAMGYQLGFPVEQALQDIAVINGRPCLWGDGLMSLALSHPDCVSITEEPIVERNTVTGYRCTIQRKGHDIHEQVFTLKDAEKAGLLTRGTVWKSYPTRMLQMRARSLAIRDKFADALRGMRIAEIEQDDVQTIDAEFSTIQGDTQTDKLKKTLKLRNANVDTTATKVDVPSSEADADIAQAVEVTDGKRLEDTRASADTTFNSGKDDEPIDEEQLEAINTIITEKKISEERITKALAYFKVAKFEHMSDAQARLFLLQLGKS